MRIFRCKTNWILASLLMMIITNGCSDKPGGCGGRKLSPAMETEYEADWKAYQDKHKSLIEKRRQAHQQWQTLIENHASQYETDMAHSEYLSAAEECNNHYNQEAPSCWDDKYNEHYRPKTGHKHTHRPVKTIPPVTSHPPKPPKPPCKGHHH